jgi:hypothetical protein
VVGRDGKPPTDQTLPFYRQRIGFNPAAIRFSLSMADWQLSTSVVTITRAGPDASCKLREVAIVPVICPTCQMLAGMTIDHPATLHGVVFDIFGGVLPGRSSPGASRPLFISPFSSHIGLVDSGP